MVVPKNDKHKEYVSYAAHCLEMVPATPDQEFAAVQRKMAIEWLRLADTVWYRSKTAANANGS